MVVGEVKENGREGTMSQGVGGEEEEEIRGLVDGRGDEETRLRK